jgi:hypothetical protein
MSEPTATPSVLFVCVKNSGKSQMAAGLMRAIAGHSVDVYSAGTQPGTSINRLSAEPLAEVGVDIGTAISEGSAVTMFDEPPGPGGRRVSLLLVEDDRAVEELIADSGADIDVVLARSTAEADAHLSVFNPDCVLRAGLGAGPLRPGGDPR